MSRSFLPVAALLALSLGACSTVAPPKQEGRISLRVADAAMAAGAPDLALRVSGMILEQEPGNLQAMIARADALYAMGQMSAARTAYRAAVAQDPKSAAAQLGLGRTLVRSNPAAAEEAFGAASLREPESAVILNNLGIARDMQGKHSAAQVAYRQALALAPEMLDVQVNLGLSLALAGRREESVALLQRLAQDPAATDLWKTNAAAAAVLAGVPAEPPVQRVAAAAPVKSEIQDEMPQLAIRAAPVAPVLRVDMAPKPVAMPAPEPVRMAMVVPPVVPPVVVMPRVTEPRDPAERKYFVQLAALVSEEGAQSEVKRMVRRFPGLLAEQPMAISQYEGRTRLFWRVRATGFPSRDAARAFCGRLRDAGADCWVI